MRAYIVVGPESSGTRVVTRLFVEAGCVGVYTHNQPLDRFIQQGKYDLNKHGSDARFVLRRSIPHGLSVPDLGKIDNRFTSQGCSTLWVILIREWAALALSSHRQGHARSIEEAHGQPKTRYLHIFDQIAKYKPNFILVDTSLMFVDPDRALRRLQTVSNLVFNKDIILDADERYVIKND